MSWKLLITCFILLVIGFTGLEIIDQKIVSVNKKISNLERQVFIDNFQNNFINYLKNLEVNFTIIKSLEPEQINQKWLTEFAISYASLHPSFDSIYLIENDTIKNSFSSNYKHLIKQLSFEQKAKINSNIEKTIQEDNVLISKPVNFFDDGVDYILYFIPIKSKSDNTVLVALFNLTMLIDNNISLVRNFEDTIFNIKTSSNKQIYGTKVDDMSGERLIVEGFESPLGVWNFEILAKDKNQFNYLRQLIWILGFALMVFLLFYMLIVEKKNVAITKNYLNVKETKSRLKVQYEIEQHLRKIIEKIHSSDNINDAFDFICNEIGVYLQLDHVGIAGIDDKATFVVEFCSKHVKNRLLGREFSNNSELYELLIFNRKEFITSNMQKDESRIAALIKESNFLNVKSAMLLPISYNDQTLALFSLALVSKYKDWSEEEINFIKAVVHQMAIALYQRNITDELDLSTRKISEKLTQEQCLRQIVSKIRTTLNVNEVLDYVCKEITIFLGLDSVAVLEFNREMNEVVSLIGSYSKDGQVMSISGELHDRLLSQFNQFIKAMKIEVLGKQFVYSVTNRFFSDYYNVSMKDYIDDEFHSKSFVSSPISTQNKIFGDLIVTQLLENRI
ncbi:MAG: GAF domain-containing protein, partial [Vampirovibrionia bacterium]